MTVEGRLTERQERILNFLRNYLRENGRPPTMREIGSHFGFSWPAAKGHLAALARKGFIRIQPRKSRAIELLDEPGGGAAPSSDASASAAAAGGLAANSLAVPIAGRIRAGEPIFANEEIEGHLSLDSSLFREQGSFALRIEGDSMKDAGILAGDFVVISPEREVRQGDIAAVMVGEEEATVKRVSFGDGTITLKPENPALEPRTYLARDVRLIGRVTGVLRKL